MKKEAEMARLKEIRREGEYFPLLAHALTRQRFHVDDPEGSTSSDYFQIDMDTGLVAFWRDIKVKPFLYEQLPVAALGIIRKVGGQRIYTGVNQYENRAVKKVWKFVDNEMFRKGEPHYLEPSAEIDPLGNRFMEINASVEIWDFMHEVASLATVLVQSR